MSRRRHRSTSALSLAVTAALSVQALVVPSAAAADPVTWQQLVAAVPTTATQGEVTSYLDRAGSAFPDGTGEALGDRLTAAVFEASESRFVDGNRFRDASAGAATFHDGQRLAAWSAARLHAAGAATAAAPQLDDALVDTLTGIRLAATTAVQDLASALGPVGVGTPAAAASLTAARQALALGDRHLVQANPEAAVVADARAWGTAYDALAGLGVSYAGDADGDGIVDAAELATGASPLVKDTDGDGLSDRFEIERLLGLTSPASPDTDGDGQGDADEDADQDGLTERTEQGLGTSPTEPDSDFDGVPDGVEATSTTSPTTADTDGDTLLDGVEGPLGLDPTRVDTDGDDTRDDREVLRRTAPAPDGLSVELVGTGDLVSGFEVHRHAEEEVGGPGAAGRIGAAYDFTLDERAAAGFAQAVLSFPYDAAELGSTRPEDLRVMYRDTDAGVWRQAAPSHVLTPGRVTVTVDHFSTYAVFDIRNWGQTWTASTPACRSSSGGGGSDVVLLDLSLVLDSSGSMAWNDPEGLRRTAAKTFVDALLPEDRAAVVDFDFWASVLQGLTTDKTAVKTAIDRIDQSGGTNIGAGVSAGLDVLLRNGDDRRARMLILLTDGEGSYSSSLTTLAASNGITIYTIGLGTSVDEALLTAIATGTGGQFYSVLTAADLPEAFRRISQDSGTGGDVTTDTDRDGLTDCRETAGFRGPDGDLYTSDPTKPDTDGDGMNDADEVGSPVDFTSLAQTHDDASLRLQASAGAVAYPVFSDPRLPDTDSDGLRDPDEEDLGTEPRRADTDGDGLSDGTEVDEVQTNPKSRNTDGDEWDDRYEVEQAEPRDLDPVVHDTRISKLSYAVSFGKGATCGTWCFDDNMAWLAGNLVAGVLGYGDAVDIVKSVFSAEWVSAGLNVLALIPVVGDGGKIVVKVTKFVSRVPRKFSQVTRLVVTTSWLPDSVKTRALKALMVGRYGRLTDMRLDDTVVRRIARGKRTDLRILADAAASPLRREGVVITWRGTGTLGEQAVRRQLGLNEADRVVLSKVPRRSRVHDGTEDLPNGTLRNHEVKTGRTDRDTDLEQCHKDGAIQRARGQIGGVTEVVWHFVGNAKYDTIGPNRELLDCLELEELPFVIHPPAA